MLKNAPAYSANTNLLAASVNLIAFCYVRWENLEKLWVFSSDGSGAFRGTAWLGVVLGSANTIHQTSSGDKTSSAFNGFHGETLHCDESSDRVTSPQVHTHTGIKENATACSSCDNACKCDCVCAVCPCPHAHTVRPCTCVLVSFYELMSGGEGGRGCSPPPQTSPFPHPCLPHDQSGCRATAPFDALAQ